AMVTSLMGCGAGLDRRGEDPFAWPPPGPLQDWLDMVDRRQRERLEQAIREIAYDLECREPLAGATLKWTTPITRTNLPNVADPEWTRIEDRTICKAVNSHVVVRADNNRCSHCHYRNSGSSWSPPVNMNARHGISKAMFAGNCANGGPAKEFRDKTSGPGAKPPGLRAMMAKWISDGCQ
ncbi:MAG: hypothetical protein OEU36_20595, partial [Gammaproteobacteria bacterium]|nr:hypothetical protein [Gammaproteobacteria bacterium]